MRLIGDQEMEEVLNIIFKIMVISEILKIEKIKEIHIFSIWTQILLMFCCIFYLALSLQSYI